MLIFILVLCYLEDNLLISTKHDQKINGEQLPINIFFKKNSCHLRRHVEYIYMHLKELNEISLNTTATELQSARRVLYFTRPNLW